MQHTLLGFTDCINGGTLQLLFVQIENPGNRQTVGCFDEPDVFARASGCRIQNAFCIKIKFTLRRTESSLLKIPGKIKRLYQFCQEIAVALASPKCCQSEVPVQRLFAHKSSRVR